MNLRLKINSLIKYFAPDAQGRRLLNVPDKVETTEILGDVQDRYCPPHRVPHISPFSKDRVTDEPCHFHLNPGRYYGHHLPTCFVWKCPHRRDMQEAKQKYTQLSIE